MENVNKTNILYNEECNKVIIRVKEFLRQCISCDNIQECEATGEMVAHLEGNFKTKT